MNSNRTVWVDLSWHERGAETVGIPSVAEQLSGILVGMTTYRTCSRTCSRTCQGLALAATQPEPTAPPSETATDTVSAPATEPEAAPPVAPAGDVNATLSLDNGETFEFFVLCTLEPQIAAGSEILFTATSFGDLSLDITQFGDEGPVVNIASVSVYDASYETLWEANSFFENFGGPTELSLDGSTITGSGTFFPGGDIALEPVEGIVVANC